MREAADELTRFLQLAVENVRHTFMESAQQAMYLPLLRDLTIEDVWEIRNFPEWHDYVGRQRQIPEVRDPGQYLDLLEPFSDKFNAFQKALSDWYYWKYRKAEGPKRYSNIVRFGFTIRTVFVAAQLGLDPVYQDVSTIVAANMPNVVNGLVAKLMVEVFDWEKLEVDRDRSYSIDILRTDLDYTKDTVLDVVSRFKEQLVRDRTPIPADISEANAGKGL
jgi:hypothetical protein